MMKNSEHLLKFVHRHETLSLNLARNNCGLVPKTLEPQRTSHSVIAAISSIMYDGLVRWDQHCNPILSQAKNVTISNSGKTYVFTLGINHWSDGSPVTAFDYQNSWRHLLSPGVECSNVNYLFFLKNGKKIRQGKLSSDSLGVSVIGEYTLKIELEKPIHFFLDLLGSAIYAPLHKTSIEGLLPTKYSTYYPLVSNGPYHLSHWSPNVEMVFEKNPYYHRADKVKFNRIQTNYFDNDMRIVDFFLNQKFDVICRQLNVLFKHSATKLLVKNGDFISKNIAMTCCCVFNCKKRPFSNLKLRKAFSIAINRSKILKRLTTFNEKVANGLLPPEFIDSEPPEFHKFNLIEARWLFLEALKELKMTPEQLQKELVIHYPHSEFYFNLAEDLREGWEFLFDVKIKLVETNLGEMLNHLSKRNFSMGLLTWGATFNHPICFLERFCSQTNPKNYSHWSSKEFVKYLNLATYAKTKEESWDYCHKADEILKENVPISPIYYLKSGITSQPYVKNLTVSPLGVINFDEVIFDEEILMKQAETGHPLQEELVTLLKQSVKEPLRKVNWYGVNFTSPYEDYLCSRHNPDV